MRRPRSTLVYAAAAALLLGCAGAPEKPPSPSPVEASEGYTLLFPGPVDTRTGRDGRATFRIDASRTPEGARFEAAWFGFPAALGQDEQQALLSQVEQGLTGSGARVVSRGVSTVLGRSSLDIVVDRPDGRRLVHHVLYPSAKAMLQVSASGPRGGEWEMEAPRFWASLSLAAAGTAADEPR